jgi:hypothetical protein
MRRPSRSRCLYNEGGQLVGGASNVMLFCFHSRLSCILLSYGMMQQRMHTCALHIDSDGIVHPEMNDRTDFHFKWQHCKLTDFVGWLVKSTCLLAGSISVSCLLCGANSCCFCMHDALYVCLSLMWRDSFSPLLSDILCVMLLICRYVIWCCILSNWPYVCVTNCVPPKTSYICGQTIIFWDWCRKNRYTGNK